MRAFETATELTVTVRETGLWYHLQHIGKYHPHYTLVGNHTLLETKCPCNEQMLTIVIDEACQSSSFCLSKQDTKANASSLPVIHTNLNKPFTIFHRNSILLNFRITFNEFFFVMYMSLISSIQWTIGSTIKSLSFFICVTIVSSPLLKPQTISKSFGKSWINKRMVWHG